MQFAILGPLQIVGASGQPCPLEPRQARLLAVLLLAADHVVTRQTLIDAVWDDHPPPTAARQLRNLIAALRHRLAAAGTPTPVILTAGPGYRIGLTDGQLDAQVFTDRVRAAQTLLSNRQTAEAVRQLRAALALWRGPALAGCTGHLIVAGAARLDEQRLTTIELCLDLELRLGRHDDLVGELTELVMTHPLRERMVGQLMLAQQRCGRQADALNTYQRLRARLADELGIEPGASLRDLHLAVLRDEVGGSPMPVSRQIPADVPVFCGRVEHLHHLDGLSAGAGPGTVVISTVAGTAGVGKTALAVHWAHTVADRYPDGQLYVNLRGYGPTGPAMTPAEAILLLLDAFDVPAQRLPVSLPAQVNLYRSLLAGKRVLVVLDNANDADQVRPLLPATPGCLALVTSRNQLTGLLAAEGADPITLDVLAPAEARQMLAARLGSKRVAAEPQALDEIINRCAGLPLALALVAGHAAAHPRFALRVFADQMRETGPLDALTSDDPVTDVRAIFSWSYQRLSPQAAVLFRSLGLHSGPEISTHAAASLTGLPLAWVRPLLGELTRAHLLSEHSPGRFTFHDLLRAYATELAHATDPETNRRTALLRALDHYLHTAHAADRLLYPHRDDMTIDQPQPGVTLQKFDDDRQVAAWFATEHAVLLAATRHAAETGFDTHAMQIAWTLVTFLDRQGHWHDQITTQRIALDAARRLQDRQSQANIHRGLGLAHTRLGRYRDARHHLQHALDLFAQCADHTGQARTHRDLAYISWRQNDHRQALHHVEQALELSPTAGHRAGPAYALIATGWYHFLKGDHQQATSVYRQALDQYEHIDDRVGQAAAWESLGHAHRHHGDHTRADTCYRQSLRLHRQLGNRYLEADTLIHLASVHHAAGRSRAARHTWNQALTILDELGHPDAEHVRAKLH